LFSEFLYKQTVQFANRQGGISVAVGVIISLALATPMHHRLSGMTKHTLSGIREVTVVRVYRPCREHLMRTQTVRNCVNCKKTKTFL